MNTRTDPVNVHSALYQCLRICHLAFCPEHLSCAHCGLSSSVSTDMHLFSSNTVRSSLTCVRLLFRAVLFFICDNAWSDSALLHCCLAYLGVGYVSEVLGSGACPVPLGCSRGLQRPPLHLRLSFKTSQLLFCHLSPSAFFSNQSLSNPAQLYKRPFHRYEIIISNLS